MSFLLVDQIFCLVSMRNLFPICQILRENINYIIFRSYGTVVFLLFVALGLGVFWLVFGTTIENHFIPKIIKNIHLPIALR